MGKQQTTYIWLTPLSVQRSFPDLRIRNGWRTGPKRTCIRKFKVLRVEITQREIAKNFIYYYNLFKFIKIVLEQADKKLVYNNLSQTHNKTDTVQS